MALFYCLSFFYAFNGTGGLIINPCVGLAGNYSSFTYTRFTL